MRTNALAVPWRACLWFLRNLGSVPFSEGYLEVLGFLMLHSYPRQRVRRARQSILSSGRDGAIPVPVRLARLVVLGRVLGLCRGPSVISEPEKLSTTTGVTYWPLRRDFRLRKRSMVGICRGKLGVKIDEVVYLPTHKLVGEIWGALIGLWLVL